MKAAAYAAAAAAAAKSIKLQLKLPPKVAATSTQVIGVDSTPPTC